ncbi:MAG: hypothetical protein HOP33_22305 [Verrucomicrobia bacterium]|nr:hypothetical protein [Verrucomicrobiota bacterium]
MSANRIMTRGSYWLTRKQITHWMVTHNFALQGNPASSNSNADKMPQAIKATDISA